MFLSATAAAFEAEKIAEMEPKDAIRKLAFENHRLWSEVADLKAEMRSFNRRAGCLERKRPPRS